MTQIPISLIKKRYASIAAAQGASGTTQGAIVFDKEHKVICVNGDVYGGNITDVVFNENHQLIISKADGTNVTLDFSDVASAQGTMTVFGQIRDVIGVDNDMSVQGQYASTHYLQGVQTLVNADIELDKMVHQVQGQAETAQGAIEATQGYLETTQGYLEATQGAVEATQGAVEATQGYLQVTQGAVETAQGAIESLQEAVIENEAVTVQAIQAIQGAVGLNSSLQYTPASDAWATQGAGNVAHAIAQLDTQVQGMKKSEKSYTIVQSGTTSQGALKTYQLQEVVDSTVTNVGVPIDIPKDFLVKSASIINVVEWPEGSGTYYDATDTSHTNPLPVTAAGKYIDFVINAKEGTATDEHLYLAVNDLVDVYTVEQNAPRVQLAIDANNEISADLVDASITTQYLQDGAVQTAKIGAQAVTSEKIGAQAVENWNIKDGAVDTVKIADGAVQTAKIANQGVTSEKIAAQGVQGWNIENGAVGTDQLANQGVTSEKIAAQGVQGWNIAQGAITSDKLADELVQVETNTPEIKVNDPDTPEATQGTTIATIGGKEIKAKVGMYWSEWSDDAPTPES